MIRPLFYDAKRRSKDQELREQTKSRERGNEKKSREREGEGGRNGENEKRRENVSLMIQM